MSSQQSSQISRKTSNAKTGFSRVSHFDIFGQTIDLTFQGQRIFKSEIGGLCSLLCFIIVLTVAVRTSLKLIPGSD